MGVDQLGPGVERALIGVGMQPIPQLELEALGQLDAGRRKISLEGPLHAGPDPVDRLGRVHRVL